MWQVLRKDGKGITFVQRDILRDRLHSHSFHSGSCCCCGSVAKFCPTVCNPMDCSMPDSSVLHYLPEFAQTRVHWISDTIQSSHPLPPPSPFAFNNSQHQGLLQVTSLHLVTKVLELQLKQTSRLFPCSNYCKMCCNEQWDTRVSFNFGFLRVYA